LRVYATMSATPPAAPPGAPKPENGKPKPPVKKPAPKKGERPKRPGVRMLFPSSGRHCFDVVPAPSAKAPSADVLVAMLARENEHRLSAESQIWLETHEDESAEDFYLCLQKRVAAEFGHIGEEEQLLAVQFMRSARAMFPDDDRIKNAVLYYKYNRSEQGKLIVGDLCPDVELFNCNGAAVLMSSLLHAALPTIFVAGSAT